MHTLATWLTATISIQGFLIPHWAIVSIVALITAEYFLGRSKNPRLRSIAGSVMSLISFIIKKTHVTDIPKVGPAIEKVLDFVAPPPVTNCTRCGGTGIEPVAPTKND